MVGGGGLGGNSAAAYSGAMQSVFSKNGEQIACSSQSLPVTNKGVLEWVPGNYYCSQCCEEACDRICECMSNCMLHCILASGGAPEKLQKHPAPILGQAVQIVQKNSHRI